MLSVAFGVVAAFLWSFELLLTFPITVMFGEKFPVSVIYAPLDKGREFICFEPMTMITNGFNLAESGKYRNLQSIPASGPSVSGTAVVH